MRAPGRCVSCAACSPYRPIAITAGDHDPKALGWRPTVSSWMMSDVSMPSITGATARRACMPPCGQKAGRLAADEWSVSCAAMASGPWPDGVFGLARRQPSRPAGRAEAPEVGLLGHATRQGLVGGHHLLAHWRGLAGSVSARASDGSGGCREADVASPVMAADGISDDLRELWVCGRDRAAEGDGAWLPAVSLPGLPDGSSTSAAAAC